MVPMPQDKVSILLPCRNEREALKTCFEELEAMIRESGINAEIILIDNASTDGSREFAEKIAASWPLLRVVTESKEGYGFAYLKGLEEAKGDYIFMADADGTYDFGDIPRFLAEIKNGSDLVLGNRFAFPIEKEVMPTLHKHLGNPLLSLFTRMLFKLKIHDIHCGARMITRKALNKITLYTGGMEFASEMVIKAAKRGLRVTEIGIHYRKRIGESKLQTFSDGWRHLRFLLLYSPLFLFLIPGIVFFLAGLFSMAALYFFEINIFGIELYFHPMFLSSLLILAGYELVFFAGFAKVYAVTHLGDEDEIITKLFRFATIERAGFLGILLALVGSAIYISIFVAWIRSGFGSLSEIKNSIVALTLIAIGIQTLFSAFMLSIVGIKEK